MSFLSQFSSLFKSTHNDSKNQAKGDYAYTPFLQGPSIQESVEIEKSFLKAAREGTLETFRALHPLIKNINYLDQDMNNAMHLAVEAGHVEIVQYLLDKTKINKHQENIDGLTPLMLGVVKQQYKVLEVLVSKDEKPNQKSHFDGYTALIMATISNDEKAVALLLSSEHLNILETDNEKKSALDHVDKEKVPAIATMLKERFDDEVDKKFKNKGNRWMTW